MLPHKSKSNVKEVPVVDISEDEPSKEPKEMYASKASNTHQGRKIQANKSTPKKFYKKDVLIVATSITNNLDKRVCENATDLTIDIATAYTVGPDADAKYPERNFLKVVPEKLKNGKYDTLVLQGGSIEITNINTRNEEKEKNISNWKNKVKKSSEQMFSLAEQSIATYPGLEVIIVSRIPRFDSTYNDPPQVKSKLSQYGNSLYHNLCG